MKKNTRILTLVFVVAFLILLAGCLPTPTPPNEAPIITSTPITTATIGVLYTYDVNATDPDGDTLTYSLITKPKGMAIKSATGVISWTPTSTQIGNNPVSVKVSDGALDIIQSFTIKVKAVNHAPAIISIPITTATVGVTYVYGVNATDPDNDVLTYSLTTYPSGMTISSATGLIMWNPTAKGNYAVVVKASDGALSDTQSFTIKVSKPPAPPPVNHAPIITSTPNLTTIVGVKYTYTIKATDPDGDTIIYSLVSGPTGMTFNGIATISWTPVLGQVGNNGVTVKASDGNLSDTQNFTITVSAVEPIKPVHNITKDIYYDTIQEAIDAADGGNTIYVANGTYEASTENSQQHSDNADWWFFVIIDKSLNLIGESQDGVILDGTLLSQQGFNVARPTCIWISASNVTVENFTIRNFYNPSDYEIYSYGVVSWKDLRDFESVDTIADVTIDNLKVQDCLASIYFMRTEYPTVKNCIVEDGLADGIWVAAGCDYATIQNNTIINSRDHGIWVGGAGWCGPSPSCDNATITDNYVDGAREGGISFVGSDGAIISGNTITNVAGDGWSVGALSLKDGPKNVEAYSNNIYNNSGDWSGYDGTGHGIGIDDSDLNTLSNINLHYNNIYGNTGHGIHNYSTVLINATNNWWGDASGPYHSTNLSGTGDEVSDFVDYSDWSESQY